VLGQVSFLCDFPFFIAGKKGGLRYFMLVKYVAQQEMPNNRCARHAGKV